MHEHGNRFSGVRLRTSSIVEGGRFSGCLRKMAVEQPMKAKIFLQVRIKICKM